MLFFSGSLKKSGLGKINQKIILTVKYSNIIRMLFGEDNSE